MNVQELKKKVSGGGFRPFSLRTTDGQFEVPHPEFILIGKYSIAVLDKKQNRVEDARAHFTEALNIYRIFAQGDPTRYANDVARIEVALQGLENNASQ